MPLVTRRLSLIKPESFVRTVSSPFHSGVTEQEVKPGHSMVVLSSESSSATPMGLGKGG